MKLLHLIGLALPMFVNAYEPTDEPQSAVGSLVFPQVLILTLAPTRTLLNQDTYLITILLLPYSQVIPRNGMRSSTITRNYSPCQWFTRLAEAQPKLWS
jgi:hypothetical protein